MRSIHKQPDGGFLCAVAAVLFLAACAWGGAGLYARLRPPAKVVAAQAQDAPCTALSGIALRAEEPVCPPASALLTAASGERLPAGTVFAVGADGTALTVTRSCLFFSDFDGLEGLRAPDAAALSVSSVRSLLDAEPQAPEGCRARLVTDTAWYYAALAPASAALPAVGPCRLRFSGHSEWLPAQLLAVSAADEDECALLFRLTRGGDYLSLRRCAAELYLPVTAS